MVPVVAALALPWVALALLTASGARRRGTRAPLTVLAGAFFPVTWVVWYVLDELPDRAARRARIA